MLSAVMNAIVLRELGGPERLVLEQVSDPEPGPGEAVVALRAAALNHRDAWIRKGLYAGITLPIILGSDGAGEVAAVGPGVDPAWLGRHVVINPSLGWGPDDRVQGPSYRILGLPDNGTYAERVKTPAENLFVKPAALSWEAAAAIPLGGLTAYRALVTRARIQPGETVLITGIGGGVATLALLIARRLGARVIVTSSSEAKLARADFSRSKLVNCDFSGADLSGADLENADLSYADLRGARLVQTKTPGTIFTGARQDP